MTFANIFALSFSPIERIESHEYSNSQLYLAALFFAALLFLLPTCLIYYAVFATVSAIETRSIFKLYGSSFLYQCISLISTATFRIQLYHIHVDCDTRAASMFAVTRHNQMVLWQMLQHR